MAKVKYGEMISAISGKIGGTVHARNKGGAYMRSFAVPTNPQTSAQSAVRSRLTSLAQQFRSLSQEQIAAWNGAAANFPSTDVFGDVRTLSGSQLFVGINSNILNGGGTVITDPPLPQGATGLLSTELVVDATAGTMILSFGPAPVPAGHALVVEATQPLSPGISNANNKFRQIAVLPAATGDDNDLSSAYNARFGAPQAGQKVFVRTRYIRLATGERSQSLVASAIVVA